MLGSANGNIGLIMGEGHISNLLVELAGLDVAEALKYLVDKDREIPLRCAYAAFDVKDGVMTAKGLAFDTTDTAIFGAGRCQLARRSTQPAIGTAAQGHEPADTARAAEDRRHVQGPVVST